MNERFEIRMHETHSALNDESFVLEWDDLLSTTQHPNAIYASPSWLAHLDTAGDSLTRVWSVRDKSGRLVGVVPVRIGEHDLQFAVKNRVLYRKRLTTAHLLGSIPLLPKSRRVFHRVIDQIFEDCPDCGSLYSDALPTDTYFWKLLHDSDSPLRNAYLHTVDGPRPWHMLQMDESFDQYLKSMSAKSRAALRRKARQLTKAADGKVSFRRVTTADDVPQFLEEAVRASRNSWQHRVLGERVHADEPGRRSMIDLADRGVLRCYLLAVDETPCAFVIGYQYGGVYQYAELGFDETCAEHSPGTVLLFFIVEDLHEHDSPTTLNFGVGDASYKQRFGNLSRTDASCLVMRKSVRNRLLTRSHSLFNHSIEIVKKIIGRRVSK